MSLYGNITNPINTQFVFDKIYPNKHLMDKKIDSDNIFYNKFVLVSYDEKPEFLEIEYTIDTNKSNYENNYRIDEENGDYNNGLGWDKTVWQKTLIDGKSTYRKIATLNNQMPNLVIKADAPLGIGESLDNNWDYNLSEQSSFPVYNLSIPAPWKFALKDDKIEYFQNKFDPETAISENEDELKNTFDFKPKVSVNKKDENGNSYIDYEDPSGEKKADTQLLTINLPSIGNAIAKVWEHLYGEIPKGQDKRILKIRPSLISPDVEGDPYNSISEGESVASVINQAYDIIGQKLIKVYETKEGIPPEEKESSYVYYISNEEKFYRYVNNQNKKGFELLSSTNEELISLLTMLLIFRREIDNLQDSTKVYKIIDSNNEYFSDGHSLIGISFGSIVEKMVDYEPYKYYQIIKNDDIEKYEIINQENLTDENSLKQGYEITFTDVEKIKFFEDNTYYIEDGDIYKFAQKDEKNQYLDTYYAKNKTGEYNYIYKENTYYYKDSTDDSYQLFDIETNGAETLYSITSTLQHVYYKIFIDETEQRLVQTNKYYYLGSYNNSKTSITDLNKVPSGKIIYLTDGDIEVGTADIFIEYSSDFYYKKEGAFYKGSNPPDPNWLNNQYNYYKLEQINDFSKEKLALDSTKLYLQENNEYKKYEGDSGNLKSLDLIEIEWISVSLRNWSSNQYYYMPNNEYYQLDKSSDYTQNINYYEINTQQNKILVTFYEKGKYYILDSNNQIYILAEDETAQKDKTYTTHNVQLREIQLRGIEQDNPESDEDNNNPNKDIIITKDNEEQTKQINIAHRKINPKKSNSTLILTPTGFETEEEKLNAKLILENNDNGHMVSYSDSFKLDVPEFKKSLEIQKKILSAQLRIHDKDKKIWKIQHNALKDFISKSTRQEILPAQEIDLASLKILRSLDLQEAINPSFNRENGIIYLLANGDQDGIDGIESKVFKVRVIIENGYDVIEEE